MVANSVRHAFSRGVSPTNREFHLLLCEEVNHKQWRQVQVPLARNVFAWSFVLRLEHLAVTFVTIKHSLRFQQEGAIE